jgi:hypothetical protein
VYPQDRQSHLLRDLYKGASIVSIEPIGDGSLETYKQIQVLVPIKVGPAVCLGSAA